MPIHIVKRAKCLLPLMYRLSMLGSSNFSNVCTISCASMHWVHIQQEGLRPFSLCPFFVKSGILSQIISRHFNVFLAIIYIPTSAGNFSVIKIHIVPWQDSDVPERWNEQRASQHVDALIVRAQSKSNDACLSQYIYKNVLQYFISYFAILHYKI